MSDRLPTREEAVRFLRQSGCEENVLRHVEAVSRLALEIAGAFRKKGFCVNLELVQIGALLHDIGRSKTHTVNHALVGAQIAQSLGLPPLIVSIIKRHVGGGISSREAKKLGWPKDIYVPQSLEEKIVSYADKLTEGQRRVPIERTIAHLSKQLPPSAIDRIWKLHNEISSSIGGF